MRKSKHKKARPDKTRQEQAKFQKDPELIVKSKLKPKTKNQEDLINTIDKNTITFAIGPKLNRLTSMFDNYKLKKSVIELSY